VRERNTLLLRRLLELKQQRVVAGLVKP
jgi:hypothetical protein